MGGGGSSRVSDASCVSGVATAAGVDAAVAAKMIRAGLGNIGQHW